MREFQGSEAWIKKRADELKGDVLVLFKTCNNTTRKMFLVDTLQHLGIDSHFEEQVNTVLSQILESDFSNSSLHEVALRFRLLREQGHWVSPGIHTYLSIIVFQKYNAKDFFL
jgi:hypothetical protein